MLSDFEAIEFSAIEIQSILRQYASFYKGNKALFLERFAELLGGVEDDLLTYINIAINAEELAEGDHPTLKRIGDLAVFRIIEILIDSYNIRFEEQVGVIEAYSALIQVIRHFAWHE